MNLKFHIRLFRSSVHLCDKCSQTPLRFALAFFKHEISCDVHFDVSCWAASLYRISFSFFQSCSAGSTRAPRQFIKCSKPSPSKAWANIPFHGIHYRLCISTRYVCTEFKNYVAISKHCSSHKSGECDPSVAKDSLRHDEKEDI